MDSPSYRSFLLRLWYDSEGAVNVWHGEVELIQTGKIIAVSSLDEAFHVIRQTASGSAELPDATGPIRNVL